MGFYPNFLQHRRVLVPVWGSGVEPGKAGGSTEPVPQSRRESRREHPCGGLKGEKMVTDRARSERSVSPVFQQGLD